MNESQFAQEGFVRQSQVLHQALHLCDSSNRGSLGMLLQHGGVMDSRYGTEEEWVKMAGLVRFRLRQNCSSQEGGWQDGSPEGHYFHRLLVACPVCGREVPIGRLHQHAVAHLPGRLHRNEPAFTGHSVYWRSWYVDADGFFRRMPNEAQRGFPSQPAGF